MKLAGKVALVTGGNSGIGLGIAHKLNDEGASGIIVGRDAQTLENASQALSRNFVPVQCDVTDGRAIAHFMNTATSLSPNSQSGQRIGKPQYVLRTAQLRTKAAPLSFPH